MYKAGYSRSKQGYKPKLDKDQKRERFEWALAHNPDKYRVGDNLGFNYRRVAYLNKTPAQVGE